MNSKLRQFRRETRADTVAECNLILIEHLDGNHVAFDNAPAHSRRRGYIRLLENWGFLSIVGEQTALTELGHLSLLEILGQMADTLILYRRKRKLRRLSFAGDPVARRNLRLAALLLEPPIIPAHLQPPEILPENNTLFSQK